MRENEIFTYDEEKMSYCNEHERPFLKAGGCPKCKKTKLF